MRPTAITRSSFETLSRQLHGAASAHFRLSRLHLNEALARGYGKGTHASLLAAFKSEDTVRVHAFDYAAFSSRLAELAGRPNAEAICVLADGIRISVAITKQSVQRQRSHLYSDIAYDIVVEVRDADGAIISGNLPFIVPTFDKQDGYEPYRVDSAHQFRRDDGYLVTRFGQDRQLLSSVLIDGRWEGRLYVYAPEHQANDERCIPAVRAALVRAILPITCPGLHCAIFRPDKYDIGAWRLELTLGAAARAHIGSWPLNFKLPKLKHRFVVLDNGFRRDVNVGGFVDGVWKADLYSNGVAENDNPTSLEEVCNAYLSQVNASLRAHQFAGPTAYSIRNLS